MSASSAASSAAAGCDVCRAAPGGGGAATASNPPLLPPRSPPETVFRVALFSGLSETPSQSFDVLGSNTLLELRQRIYCKADFRDSLAGGGLDGRQGRAGASAAAEADLTGGGGGGRARRDAGEDHRGDEDENDDAGSPQQWQVTSSRARNRAFFAIEGAHYGDDGHLGVVGADLHACAPSPTETAEGERRPRGVPSSSSDASPPLPAPARLAGGSAKSVLLSMLEGDLDDDEEEAHALPPGGGEDGGGRAAPKEGGARTRAPMRRRSAARASLEPPQHRETPQCLAPPSPSSSASAAEMARGGAPSMIAGPAPPLSPPLSPHLLSWHPPPLDSATAATIAWADGALARARSADDTLWGLQRGGLDMACVPLRTLSVRLGAHYLYSHCDGSCEHTLVFMDARLLSSDDAVDLPDSAHYPRLAQERHVRQQRCHVCLCNFATCVVRGDRYSEVDNAHFCARCYDQLYCDAEGNLIHRDFHVSPYFHD